MYGLKEDLAVKQFQAAQDKARVYIYREDKFVGGGIKMTVMINGALVGQLTPGTFFALDIQPGKFNVSCIAENNSEVSFDANKGELIFIANNATWGAFSAGCEVLQTSDEQAKPVILKSKRARDKF